MKKTILALFLLLVVGCNSNKTGVIKNAQPQVDSTIIEYAIDNLGITVRTTFAYKVIRPVEDTTKTDDGNLKISWKKDTSYFIPMTVPMFDSLKHPILDSLKKPKYEVRFFPLPKDYLIRDTYKKLPLKAK